MAPQRNLVFLFDGTGNTPEQTEDGLPAKTNVVKFNEALSTNKAFIQRPYYEEGVGTRIDEDIDGNLFGAGIQDRLCGAYRFLQKRFSDQPAFDDKLFIFGFSRGAYTARLFSWLLNHSGIPLKQEDCELGFKMFWDRDASQAAALKKEGRFAPVKEIEMLGVWDTVKSCPAIGDYNDHELAGNVKAGYHAMSIDETRRMFPVLKWDADARVKQLWFAGVHSDVGGGYASSGLSDIALLWMMKCAGMFHGLAFDGKYAGQLAPDESADQHNEFKGKWVVLGETQRPIDAEDLVYDSVRLRIAERADYHPSNLPATPCYSTFPDAPVAQDTKELLKSAAPKAPKKKRSVKKKRAAKKK